MTTSQNDKLQMVVDLLTYMNAVTQSLTGDNDKRGMMATYSSPMEMRCWPMSRTISWSVCEMCSVAGGAGSAVPLRVGASPLICVCGGGAPLAHGWCMAAGWAGGDSLRDRLRGGRCPAPSSPESLEARLAREPRPERRAPRSAEITSAPAASASKPPPSDVTVAPPALSGPSPFVRPRLNVAWDTDSRHLEAFSVHR